MTLVHPTRESYEMALRLSNSTSELPHEVNDMKLRATILLFAAFCFLVTAPAFGSPSICDAVPGNLVTNCGFETGNFNGWTLALNTGFSGVDGNANSGNYAAFLGPIGSDGTLTQLVGDNSTLYFFAFYLANDGGTPNDFTVLWNGINVGPGLVDYPAFPYTEYAGFLPGNSGAGSNTLTFLFRQDPAYWHLDDVIVTNTTPEPGTIMLFGTGILGLAGVIRRKLSL
jgi:hypothetical protein